MSLGIVFAFLSAASFGFNAVGVRRGVAVAAASQGLYITIFTGTIGFVVLAALTQQLFQAAAVTGMEYGFMVAGGIVHILIGRYCNYRAIGAMGANRASPVVGMSTLTAVIIAVLFLDELITPLMAVGILLVLFGPSLVGRRSQRPTAAREPQAVPSGTTDEETPIPVAMPRGASPGAVDNTRSAFEPRLMEGYAFGILAALFWGAGPVLMRAGVSDNGLGILGGLVSYAAAAAVLAVSLFLPGQMAGLRSLQNSTRLWFLLGGSSSFLANVFRYSALALAPVSIVIPLMRLSVLFAVIFNFLVNRHLETFEPRVLIGIFVSLIGATLLVI